MTAERAINLPLDAALNLLSARRRLMASARSGHNGGDDGRPYTRADGRHVTPIRSMESLRSFLGGGIVG